MFCDKGLDLLSTGWAREAGLFDSLFRLGINYCKRSGSNLQINRSDKTYSFENLDYTKNCRIDLCYQNQINESRVISCILKDFGY
jgi:hypothetical protein